jgi:hypothetical protein
MKYSQLTALFVALCLRVDAAAIEIVYKLVYIEIVYKLVYIEIVYKLVYIEIVYKLVYIVYNLQ